MVIQQSRLRNNLTITLFDKEGDVLIEAIDAIVDPVDNEPSQELAEFLKQFWLKLHAARSH